MQFCTEKEGARCLLPYSTLVFTRTSPLRESKTDSPHCSILPQPASVSTVALDLSVRALAPHHGIRDFKVSGGEIQSGVHVR